MAAGLAAGPSTTEVLQMVFRSLLVASIVAAALRHGCAETRYETLRPHRARFADWGLLAVVNWTVISCGRVLRASVC